MPSSRRMERMPRRRRRRSTSSATIVATAGVNIIAGAITNSSGSARPFPPIQSGRATSHARPHETRANAATATHGTCSRGAESSTIGGVAAGRAGLVTSVVSSLT